VSPDDVRATVMALVHYIDARKWKELQELLAGMVAEVSLDFLFQSHYQPCSEEEWQAFRKRFRYEEIEMWSGTLSKTLAQSINDWSRDSSWIAGLKATRGT
jgi:hypothetical protein